MPDGRSDTWAVWKSDVFSLPDDQIRRYLAEVEHFTPERIEEFFARGAAVTPEDWVTSDSAHEAVQRLMAFIGRVEPEPDPGRIDPRGARGAALDADEDSGAAGGDVTLRRERVTPPDEGSTGGESNASNYGGAALPPP